MITRDKEGHYVIIKKSINEEDITINIYPPKHVIQTLTDLKGEMDNNSVIVEVFNTSLSTMERSSREKISKETLDLNYTLY